MNDDQEREQSGSTDPAGPPPPQGHFAGVPYDLRRPTLERARSRMWNREDPRLFTPKTFGWGYDVNLYWLAHPTELLAARRRH